jgi:polyphosphate kinase
MMGNFSFFNRDASWLSFNERVLQESANERSPLMERIRFLSIYSSNLDEFYRVRMPAILALQKIHHQETGNAAYTEIAEIINRQQSLYGTILNDMLVPALKQKGYYLLNDEEIPHGLDATAEEYFFTQVAGYLHPVLLSPDVNFFPENNRLYVAVIVQRHNSDEQLFLLNVPVHHISRFFKIQQPEAAYIVFLEDVLRRNLRHLFAGASVKGAYNVKITRNAELDLADEYGEDIAEKMEHQLNKRDLGLATRFLYEPGIPLRHLQTIIQTFNLQQASVVEGGRHHNLKDLSSLPVTDPQLSYQPWKPIQNLSTEIKDHSLFETVAQGDQIIHTPYQSYDAVIRFFNEAAIDNAVTEIYTTLYRVASHSKIVHALISAAKNGKKVTVLVELKARFDESNNIYWAKQMKAAGVRIIYSSNALKVHAKIALVKRPHCASSLIGLLSTGNLNETTARFYTDHILLTAHQSMLAEVENLFTFLSKKKKPDAEDSIVFQHLLVAQFNLQPVFLSLIARETAHARSGKPAAITIKLNNLEEEKLITALYEASNAGVSINVIVRSICRIVPGVKNQSENIVVKRIVDRYLEHGRVFIFYNNGEEEVYLGSADWMNRNIYRRIEVCFPVYDEKIREKIRHIIHLQCRDNMQAVYIDGSLNNIPVQDGGAAIQSQEAIYDFLLTKHMNELKEK